MVTLTLGRITTSQKTEGPGRVAKMNS